MKKKGVIVGMWDKIKEMLYTFSYVTTGVLFATALFITIFYRDESLSVPLLWEILITSFLCVFGNLIHTKQVCSKRQSMFRLILHYLYVNMVVFGCAGLFQWFNMKDIKMVGFMILCIAVIFLAVSWVVWHNGKKVSDLLNKQLEEYQDKKTEYLCGGDTKTD